MYSKIITILVLLLALNGFSSEAEGLYYYRSDIPSAVCNLKVIQKGAAVAWTCVQGNTDILPYSSTSQRSDGKQLFHFSRGGLGLAVSILEGFQYVWISAPETGFPSVLFVSTTIPRPSVQPVYPVYPSNGGGGGTYFDLNSCLKAADDAERTANMMDEGVSKTMLMQNVIAARARCYNH
jgi:hypothetical protein